MTLSMIQVSASRDLSSLDVYDLADEIYDARPACERAADPDLWFPEMTDCTAIRFHHAEAFQVCDVCPVKALCLEFALRSSANEYGIWAGTTECERAAIRARRAGSVRPNPHVGRCASGRRGNAAESKAQAA